VIYDFSITDLTPRPGHVNYYSPLLGRRVWVVGHKVTDARGQRLLYVTWCDSATGEVVRLDRRPDGTFAVDPVTQRLVEIRERRPAPLRVVEMKPGEPYLE
jgi:hypothetical protein